MSRAKNTTFNLKIKINGKEVENTYNSIKKEMYSLRRELKKLTPGTEKFIKKSTELKKAEEAYSNIKKEVHGTNDVLQEAFGNWQNLIFGITSGNYDLASKGLKGIAGNIKSITKAALAFIATPIGAALAVLTTVGLGVKKWVQYNIEIEKTNQLIRDLTQETGNAVDAIRIRAEVLKKTFEVDINKSVETAKSLAKNFGISYNEAFNIIEDGAIRGKLKNDDYLNSLKEYPVQFKNAGFSAQDFANIVSAGIDLSIYTDKLPDAIKEFNLAITEQTKASREALINAFGEEFTNKLLKGVKDGSISAKEALALISDEAERIGLNSQQAQLLTADLFKGAGEDAGGALKILEAVNTALNEQKKPLTEIQKIQKDQLEANKELKGVYTQLFASGSKGFNLWIQKGKLFATKTLIKILKGGVDIYNWFVDLNNESGTFSAILKSLGLVATSSFKIIGILASAAWDSFKGLGNIVAGVFTLDWDRIKKGFGQGAQGLVTVTEKLKKQAIKDASEIVDAWNGNNKMERLSLDDFIADDPTPTEDTSNTTDTNTNGLLTPEDQRIIDSKKKLAEFLDQWEKDRELQKEIENLDKISQEEEKEIAALEAKLMKMEEEAGILGAKEGELSEADRLLKERLEEAKEQGIAAIRKKYSDKRQKDKDKADKEYEKKLKKHHERLAKAEEDLERAKANALRFGINTLKNAFSERSSIYKALFAIEKAVAIAGIITHSSKAIAEITAATAIANSKAIAASPLTGGMPWVAINTATAAKQTLATKINAGVQIASIAASALKGFKDGGYTTSLGFKDHTGENVAGVVHADEYVVPKFVLNSTDPAVPVVMKYLEHKRKEKLGYFNTGGSTSTTPPEFEEENETTTLNESNTNNELLVAVQTLNGILGTGIEAFWVESYEDFVARKETLKEFEEIYNNTRQ